MSTKREKITLSCSLENKVALEALALKLGYAWGDRPNVSALVEGLAIGDLVVEKATQKEKIEAQMKRLEDQLKELK